MKRSKSMESRMLTAAEEKRKLLKNVETAEDLKICPLTHHKNRLVLMEDVTLSYGSRRVLEGLSLHVGPGREGASFGAQRLREIQCTESGSYVLDGQ